MRLSRVADPACPVSLPSWLLRLLGVGLGRAGTDSTVPTAFEDMLENPLSSTQWMNDPETGPVMLQISRIFQTLNRT